MKTMIEVDGLKFEVGDKVRFNLANRNIGQTKKECALDYWSWAFNRNCSDQNEVFEVVRIKYSDDFDSGFGVKVMDNKRNRLSFWMSIEYFKKV